MQSGSNGERFGPYSERHTGMCAPVPPAEVEAVMAGVRHLASGDKPYFRGLVGLLQDRRLDGMTQVDLCDPGDDDPNFGVLVMRGELVTRTEAVDERFRELIAGHGPLETKVPAEFEGRITRFTLDVPMAGMVELVRQLRRAGYPASANHVTPLNPWVKGDGGPENTTSRPAPFTRTSERAVTVAVVDTGIARPDRTAKDRLLDVERIEEGQPVPGNIDELQRPGEDVLGFGAAHGTFVAGVLAQASRRDRGEQYDARIQAYRALDVDGIGSEITLGAAMIRAVRDGARVVNLSVGSQTLDDVPPVALQVALEIIDDHVSEHGRGDEVAIVAAAGNYGDRRPCWPAAFKRVVSVGALDDRMQPTVFSSRGATVDCSTVGQGIVSTFVTGRENPAVDTRAADEWRPGGEWALWYGTSFAAPQICGLVAQLCAERPELTPRGAVTEILRNGTRVPDFGKAVRIMPGV
ncbi:S8 family peptidase [Pseudonocardia humida]|uniref:S8/S53 family peptidase n=1 Tax=Pseudonocardia humida TaxID=2800819 RepID=A0ABT1A8P3_9PSEU|nr:S8/S53 family peptidase [Pseudonocardia humida]MCO1659283.1 S8/S53 family peptidase [Pseudonocardia humida]